MRAPVRAALALAIALALPGIAAAAPDPRAVARVAALIPDGAVTADVLTPHFSPQMQQTSRRLINAAQSNPLWFQAWVAAHPRPPLPWHPNMGVSRPEYDRYLEESRRTQYTTSYRARLTFERLGRTHRWALHGWGQLGPLEGLTLDLDLDKVNSTRYGPLPGLGISAPNEPGVALPWQWYGVWKSSHVVGDPRSAGQAMSASLHIGPLGDGRTVGLYWVARRLNGGRKLADEFLLLRYPAPRR